MNIQFPKTHRSETQVPPSHEAHEMGDNFAKMDSDKFVNHLTRNVVVGFAGAAFSAVALYAGIKILSENKSQNKPFRGLGLVGLGVLTSVATLNAGYEIIRDVKAQRDWDSLINSYETDITS